MIEWIKSKLVPDAKDGWKWVSTQSMGLSLALVATWQAVPDDIRSIAPDWLLWGLLVGLLVIGFIGRFWKQGDK